MWRAIGLTPPHDSPGCSAATPMEHTPLGVARWRGVVTAMSPRAPGMKVLWRYLGEATRVVLSSRPPANQAEATRPAATTKASLCPITRTRQ